MADDDHVHGFSMVMHMDGCHWYSTSYACPCGAGRVIRGERDFSDPESYAGVWMLEDCERCAELSNGAKAEFSDEIIEAR